jgi:hypothetical protein
MDSNSRSPFSGDTPQRPLIASPGIISAKSRLALRTKGFDPFAEIPRAFARCRHKGLGLNRTHDDLVGHLRRSGSPLFCRRETSYRLLARAFSEMQAPGPGGVHGSSQRKLRDRLLRLLSVFSRGTEGSNPSSSCAEASANRTSPT